MELFGRLSKNGLLASEDTTRPSVPWLPGWHSICQHSQIWQIGKRLAVKQITCWHFNLKCPQEIFLLPTNSKYAKFEKVGIKTRTWQPWIPPKVQGLKTSQKLLHNEVFHSFSTKRFIIMTTGRASSLLRVATIKVRFLGI